MKKKISYVELLKEAISEYDTKSFDVKGPMLDPIISYDGGGELETHKDASSVLERYYFKEKDERVFVEQDVQEKEPEENEIESGEEADDVDETMDDLEDELMEEFMLEDDEEGGSDKVDGVAKVPAEFEKEEGGDFDGIAESMEQAVIEKLISEMEEFESADDEGTTQAGTDLASEDEVDKVVEELELEMLMLEQEEEEAEGGEKDEKEGEDLDVDKEVAKESSYGMGIVNNSAADQIEEAFRLFKEQIEDSEEKDEEKEKEVKEKEGVVGESEGLDEEFMFEDDDVDGEEGAKEDAEEEDLDEFFMLEDEDLEDEENEEEEAEKDVE